MPDFQLVSTEWFDADAIRLPDYQVGRVNYGNGRSYIRIKDGQLEQPFRLYTSLTTAIGSCAPMEQPLLEWHCKHGYEESKRLSRVAADYGTLMHIEIGKYLADNFYDFDAIKETIVTYCSENNIQHRECREWKYKLPYDMAAFIAFSQEYNIKPLGIEYVLLSDRGFGTLIDLVCKMDVEEKGFFGEVYKSGERKGEPKETKRMKEITAIINFKSGRHGFYRSNGIQAICEQQLFEENFPDIKIDCAYNWSPKEWREAPSWNLKDWAGEISTEEIEAMLSLAEIRYGSKAMDKKYIDINGMAFRQRHVTDCIKVVGVEQYCKDVYSQYL